MNHINQHYHLRLENSTTHLEAAIGWFRLRLTQMAAAYHTSTERSRLFDWLQQPKAATPCEKLAQDYPSDEALKEAETLLRAVDKLEPAPALHELGDLLGLSRFERYVLLLCIAVELDPQLAVLCGCAQDDATQTFPTYALISVLFDGSHLDIEYDLDILNPSRALRRWGLIDVVRGRTLNNSQLRVDERIIHYVKGTAYDDDFIFGYLFHLELADIQLSEAQSLLAGRLVSGLGDYLPYRELLNLYRAPRIQLIGHDRDGKRQLAQAIALHMNVKLLILSAASLPAVLANIETFRQHWERYALLTSAALYIDASEIERSSEVSVGLRRLLDLCGGVIFADVTAEWAGLQRTSVVYEIDKPSTVEQRALWMESLGDATEDLSATLAGQFDLSVPAIRRIARQAVQRDINVRQLCREETQPRMHGLAQLLKPKAIWDDLVLPDTEKQQLRQLTSQMLQRPRVYDDWGFRDKQSRGLGINALFAGPSGTGKTMAAEVVANELGENLLRIDLSAVVSKYIGETEKNLATLFDEAQVSSGVLFFDEADALFGKRSEVKDSHDRYANIEINYLLQRMEAYRGLAILATNMKNALDPAFMRRLRFIVNFPFPGAAERKLIWQRVFPAQLPLALTENDYEWLARLNLTGGSINNVAMNAAFMAASETPDKRCVTLDMILTAARAEFRKLDLPQNEVDLRPPVR